MSNKNLNCKITSVQETKFYNKLKSITLPTKSGRMQILPLHAESFILIKKGDIFFKKNDGSEDIWSVGGGQCHIKNNEVVIVL